MKPRRPRSRPRLRYGARELVALAGHPLGRRMLRRMSFWLAWPLLYPLAWAWRRGAGRRITITAVTGSFGKTTTARLAAAALDLDPEALPSNFGSFLARALLVTPRRAPLRVLEVGISRRGQMRPYARMIRPDTVVVTSVGSEHSRVIGSLDDIAAEKSELVRGARPDGNLVLNGDDPRVLAMAALGGGRALTYGFAPECDFRATDVRLDWPRGTRFVAVTPAGTREVRLALFGEPAVRAALAALAVASLHGVGLDDAAARIAPVAPLGGRLRPFSLPSGAWLLSDHHKSGWETFAPALELLAELPARRRFVVLGNLTEAIGRPNDIYRELGERVARVASRVLYLGHGFRPFSVGARRAGMARDAVTACADVSAAAAILGRELGDGDVALVKGRANDKLERLELRLAGREVNCNLRRCNALGVPCGSCPMLERGWGDRRPVT